jgi:nicotinamidase-related amidase
MTETPVVHTSTVRAPNVPSTIYTTTSRATSRGGTIYQRRTKITFNKEEEVTIMSPGTAKNNPIESGETTPSVEEPYQELKWNHAPLFLNEGFDSPEELLKNNKQTLPIHAGNTALLVVDVQPEYWSQCPAVREDFPDFPKNLGKLVKQCRQQKAKIIWVRADYRYAHSPWLVQFARLHKGRIPSEVHSDPKNDNIQWEEFATPEGGEYVIPKTSWSSTRHTALMDLLKQSGIDTVLVCGLITSVCVQHSAFGIFEAGYRTLLVTDACADRGKARHDAALALYGDYMYELLTVEDLCQPKNPFYLQAAKPVWLTPESVDNLVQPMFFNSLQDSIVTKSNFLLDADDTRTTTASNKGEHPIFYKVASKGSSSSTEEEEQQSRPLKGGTLCTSASSLSTLSLPPHEAETDASPVCVSEAPQQPPPDDIRV